MENSNDKKKDDPEEMDQSQSDDTGVAELEEARKEAEENLAGWQRAKADFLNYKKDQENRLNDFRKFANEDMIVALLPTIDSFELATRHMPEELKDSDWAKGILCIKGMFENFLRDAGVSEIEAVGEKFDPNLFEAIAEIESDAPEDTVVEEIQKGYKMGDKVIRPAKVKIAK